MQQSTHNLGHRKHRKAFGRNPVSSRQKLRLQIETNKEAPKKPKPEMKETLAEVWEPRRH